MENVTPILIVKNLSVTFDGTIIALDNVDFQLEKGKITALIGASGSGKSITSLCMMGFLPANAQVSGELFYQGKNLLNLSEKEWQNVRGKDIAMIFQEPMSALNPLMKCGEQIAESLKAHHPNLSNSKLKEKAIDWINKVQIPEPESSYHKYPHQMSGGQKQRVMIAMAMINEPNILIADEPTTALDVLVQKEIIGLIKELQKNTQTTVLFITHDLSLAQTIADDFLEMKAGKIVDRTLERKNIHFKESQDVSQQMLLDVKDVSVTFLQRKNILKAVNNVSLQIYENETVGLVGGSGCGKTTLSKAILGLEKISSGELFFKGKDISHLSPKEWRAIREDIQIIFQDPYASLNPRIKIGDAIAEPLKVHTKLTAIERKENVLQLLQEVGLSESDYHKYPHEFSGGQRQRICIARSIALHPSLVICDESVAALDIIVQAQVLDLLQRLQKQYKMSYLFITHDINVVKKIADRIIVMESGKIVESNITKEVLLHPKNDYTKALIEAVP